jgi:hypothetical protein
MDILFEKQLNDIRKRAGLNEERITQVYHITHDKHLPEIRKNGLVPRLGENSKDIGETIPAVHVFLNMDAVEEAMMNWDSMDWHDEDNEGQPVLLSLLTLRVPLDMVHSSSTGEQFRSVLGEIYETIPPSMIASISEIY